MTRLTAAASSAEAMIAHLRLEIAGFDRGGDRTALMYTLIVTAKLNDVDPQAWLADVLARIAEHPISRLDELLPWIWEQTRAPDTLAA